MSEQLSPCPFCGSTNLDMRDARDFITCRDCGAEGPYQPGVAAHAWNTRTDHIGDVNKKVGQDCPPVLVRDLAEILGRAVTDVMSAFIVAGLVPHSPNMAVSGEDALAVAAVLKKERQDCEPVAWMDREGDVYKELPCANWCPPHTPLYAATPKREPLSDDQLWSNDEIMSLNADFGWHMDTIRMFARAIERAHGIEGQS